MKKLAIVSFDICRPGEPQTAFAVGSILASLQNDPNYGHQFEVKHFGYNLYSQPGKQFEWEKEPIDWNSIDHLAISCYIWSHSQSLSLMQWIKKHYPDIQIIAGGYQINSNNYDQLKSLYPHADRYIIGYAEKALVKILTDTTKEPIIKTDPEFVFLPSPFLAGTIKIDDHVHTLRMETKRGCPYACTFCAQHDVGKPQTHFYLPERLEAELEFVKSKNIHRVSITDPVFNMGKTYVPFMKKVQRLGLHGIFNFQVRPELISSQKQFEFLDLLAHTQSEIELGIQTFDPLVNQIIKRKNQYGPIDDALAALLDRNIQFGISLIYGLPGQTLDSFKKDIDKVTDLGIRNVIAFPLMLLPGTELYAMRGNENMKERVLGEYCIPHVVASSSFTESDWEKMYELAVQLNPSGRIF